MKIRCPGCAKEVSYAGNPYRPFCSHRCKTADLASWADEEFRIPDDKTTEAANNTINQEDT